MSDDVMDRLVLQLTRLETAVRKLTAKVGAATDELARLKQVINAGYVLTEPEIAGVLAQSEQATMAHARPHPVAPAPDAIVFGPDMREIEQPWAGVSDSRYPLLSTCTCGRQIATIAAGKGWEYCGA